MNLNQQQHPMLIQQQKKYTSTQAKFSKAKPQIIPKILIYSPLVSL
jgi:hypothetical protein